MNMPQPTASFAARSPREKTEFLLRLAHELTILGRDTYAVGHDGLTCPSRLRLLNEVQHRILGFLLALVKNDPRRYPDDVLVRIILEHPEDEGLQREVEAAFLRLLAQVPATASQKDASPVSEG
jgi:hypothetical protein